MLEKGSEDDDSLSKNLLEIWKVVAPVLITIVPILVRLANARTGVRNGGSQPVGSTSGMSTPDESPANLAPGKRKAASDEDISVVC
jgi:hypothetical protein